MSQSDHKVWNNIANMYEDKFMSMDIYNATYDKFCSLLKSDGSLLEVGCGPGNITNYLQNKQPHFNILSTDFAEKMVELAKTNVPKANFRVLDARLINTLNGPFHGILAGFIFPYFTKDEVQSFFQNCRNLLAEKGVIYFSFVAGNEEDSHLKKGSTGDELFFRYHEKEFIEESLESTGYQIIEKFEIPYEGVEKHTVIIAQK